MTAFGGRMPPHIGPEARTPPHGRNSTTAENTGETDVSDAVGAVLGAANEIDDSLRELVEIWGEVSTEIQHAILTIARQSRTS